MDDRDGEIGVVRGGGDREDARGEMTYYSHMNSCV